jgi:predicted HTH transcriptional regulator
MTLQDLTQLVSLGEGSALEFKRKVHRPERIAKEVIAFANSRGGRILLGIDDDGTVVGVKDAEEEEYALRQALLDHCEPPIDWSIERVPVTPKREVIVVSVPESGAKPHYLVGDGRGGDATAYVRVEDMSVEASKETVRLMKTEKRTDNVLFQFGEKEQLLMRYLETYGRITVDQFANLANVPAKLASHTLVLLTRANVLRLHVDPKQDYFTLAYALPE